MFPYNATGIDPSGGYDLLPPDQWFPFQIIEAVEQQSKNGHPMVKCTCEVVEDTQWKGKWVWHYVVFLPKDQKGAGIAVHFLKSCGLPFEGDLKISADDWNGCRFMGRVGVKEYNGKKSNFFAEISPFRDQSQTTPAIEAMNDESIPF